MILWLCHVTYATWLMMVTRVLGWSKVHDDSAKGPMMVTRPYNTLATITKTCMVYHLRSLQQPQSPQHHHRATHTFLGPLFLPWQHHKDLGCSSHHCNHHYKPLGIFTECLTHSVQRAVAVIQAIVKMLDCSMTTHWAGWFERMSPCRQVRHEMNRG